MKGLLLLLLCCWYVFPVFAQKAERFSFVSLPVLQAMSPHGVDVRWVTSHSSTSWVEYGETPDLGSVARYARHGLFDANLPVQRAELGDLKPGTTYYYRAVSAEITRHQAYLINYGDTLYSEIYSFTTPGHEQETFAFLAFNDVHDRHEFIADVVASEDPFDFVAYLGDIMGHIDQPANIVESIMKPAASYFATEKPLFYVRGNHEARGAAARSLPDYLATPDGQFYYSFSYGPVFFIVLDTGEDKPDTNQYYYGLANFDHYRLQQAQWLQQVVSSSEYQLSAFRIALVHWPVLLSEVVASDEIHRHGRANAQEHFAELLHGSGIDLMLCGHTHHHELIPPAAGISSFPVVVGGGHSGSPGATYTRVDFRGDRLLVSLKNIQGELIEQLEIK